MDGSKVARRIRKRIGDDYFRSFTDHYEEQEVLTDPLHLLAKAAAEATGEEHTLFEDILNAGKGISINGSWHTFEEIVPVLRKALYEEE